MALTTCYVYSVSFLTMRRRPWSTRTDTPFPSTALFRSEVARRCAARPALAFARQADTGAFGDAGGNVDRQGLGSVHAPFAPARAAGVDRKSTRLNSSH